MTSTARAIIDLDVDSARRHRPLAAIEIDGHAAEDRALTHVWNECVGAGRANEALRADWREHFTEAVQTLGMRSVRFHGLFHDDMFVYRVRDGGGFGPDSALERERHTFSYVDKVFDFILASGARPFVELGFMPRELATDHATVFWWGAHASPPNDMAAWVRLVAATVEHWIGRYGLDEVRRWKFEVWNEPNLVPHFWTGTKTQYFELYAATARAIKAIHPDLQVGGPSTSVFVPDSRYDGETEDRDVQHATAAATDVDALEWRPVWIEEFLEWCAARDLPVDFVTTHVYPTDYAYAVSGKATLISRYADATRDDLALLRRLVAAGPYPHAEVHITEWSTTPSSRDSIHDTVFAATYITRAYLQCTDLAESISYWTFTDVFEEGGAGIGPFHGGFGVVNEQGIRKPTFHAFAALARLGDRRLLSTEHGVLTGDSSSGAVSGVFFNYPDEMGLQSVGSRTSYAATRELRERGPSRRIRHRVRGLVPGTAFLVEVVDLDHGDVAEAWHRMGEPLNLSPAQTASLREVAEGLRRFTLTADADGALDLDLHLQPWAVASLRQA
ncbi:beta-xylosidase [Microbacterium sp. zg.Y1090]|uniref:GH39 family glycosyl hydrolase n=1 Tax=Microbacterium TaxID=33882 RepID=UPI00214ACB4C|nr:MULTISPECIES: beta-xylosidase [unclassified Microbacterium]MCR2812399.1 beta-xylosidase [Microbacterium sp. zg.Y1084]MCR2817800.1 beta-xylosidase [Microbacterium sp. zg.Y1090]WIM28727.1 beta-xylosidase [Microbacterium sp. zg-Y1090]